MSMNNYLVEERAYPGFGYYGGYHHPYGYGGFHHPYGYGGYG
jgi:hypothetical protein